MPQPPRWKIGSKTKAADRIKTIGKMKLTCVEQLDII